MSKPAAVTVGMFDGVHRGHRYVVERLAEIASRKGYRPVAVTFDRHPLSVISPDKTPLLLSDIDTRVRLLREAGAEDVVVLPFDSNLRDLTAAGFAEKILVGELGARTVLLGFDNGFGSDRLKGREEYIRHLSPLDIEVLECDPYPGRRVSSSDIRAALARGDMQTATQMLGRLYRLRGPVVSGHRLGRTIGFPTANVATPATVQLPLPGVYAAVAGPSDGSAACAAMVNIGTAPTVNADKDSPLAVEVHLLTDSHPDLYGKTIDVDFVERIRDERRFGSLDELKAALENDRDRVKEIVGRLR